MMNSAETALLQNIDNPKSCFIFPTDTAASRWADHLLRLRGGSAAMNKFIAWDVFKRDSIKSKVQNKKSIPSALRKIFVSRLLRENAEAHEQGKTPLLSSLIRAQWAGQGARFTPWLTRLLPQLGSWFAKTTGLQVDSILGDNAKQAALKLEGDDKDMYILAERYAQFLEANGLFEPAWETPPFTDTGLDYFIFFPESLSDYSEYRELLAASDHVKTISAEETENIPCDTFFYTNSRSEITEAALYIRALRDNGVDWDAIAVCLPDQENYEPYVLREFKNRNIPFVKRSSKPLTDYPAGQFFRSVIDCASRDFAFSAFVLLVLNKNLPWKDTDLIHNLVDFGIKNNCISSWTEEKDGKERAVNVWEDAFEQPFGGIDPKARKFFGELKRRLLSLRNAESFAEVRRQYFIFREFFFDMEKCSDETDLILSRCISELMYLTEIEKDFPNVFPAVDPFLFLGEYLSEINYLAQTDACGVTILPYKTAACAPFDCHIVLGAGQDSMSVVFSRLDFLPRKKREKLGIFDEDASLSYINLHKFNSLKNAAFFCCEQSFSGYTIPHSKIGAPSEPKERYATDPQMTEKFAKDYYSAENSFLNRELSSPVADNGKQLILHENQKTGFDEWNDRRRQTGDVTEGGGKWSTNNILQKKIRERYAKNPQFPGKYSVSASGMAPYFYCSLKWLFENALDLENVEVETSLMAENISGMMYHAALNLFFTDLKEKKEPLLKPDYTDRGAVLPLHYRDLLNQSVSTIFDGFPKLPPEQKSQMSSLTARLLRAGRKQFQFHLENCLANFLSLFEGCIVAGCETWYHAERDQYYLNGKLDCILENDSGEFIIVDFKTKKMPKRKDCTGDTENGLSDYQLPMYITLTEENEKREVHTGLFYSILETKPQIIFGKEKKQIQRGGEQYDLIFGEFNQKTEQFGNEIATGRFTVFNTNHKDCVNCGYNRICRTTYIINREKING